jgi:hypothetical protein
MACSLQANYTDWAAAAGRRIFMTALTDRGVSRGQRDASKRPLISIF